jgi:hypothetical protein
MSETVAEYVQRLHGYLGGKDPVQSLRETPGKLTDLVRDVPEATLRRPPAPGKWSVAEIMAHLVDSELVAAYRIRAILGAEDGAPIAAYDQDRWAAAGNYGAVPAGASLASFSALRAMNLRLLESLSASAWNKYGMHAERGRESIRDLVQLLAGHDLNHLSQIGKILADRQAARA